MKISFDWLSKYIDIQDYRDRVEELADLLTNAGLEVENIENQAQSFADIVVGNILEKKQHPNADRLTLCQVSTGHGVVQQIVCGAKNHNEGDNVVVALPGAVLPGGLKIQKTQMRGFESAGMLCSEKELGLSNEGDGILILDQAAELGRPISDHLDLKDILFELKVTPNRADCLSHLGLARELSSLLNREFRLPEAQITESSDKTKDFVEILLMDSENCPRYTGRCIKGVKVGDSPAWLKKSLERIGLNSINNIVDVTNFVMMELGQPLHAFDLKEIKNQKLEISPTKEQESFTSLDGTDYKLKADDLVIRDSERVLALAGVVGGKNSGVTVNTQDIFLECAFFTAESVRKSARRHGIETDSSYRFSRGIDPEGILFALDRACQLIQEVAGGEISSEPYDQYPAPLRKEELEISFSFLQQKLGMPVEKSDFVKILKSLHCQVEEHEEVFKVKTPLYRWDLLIAEDLVEEFARIYGYDKIPSSIPNTQKYPSQHSHLFLQKERLSDFLSAFGYAETMTYAFVNHKQEQGYIGEPKDLSKHALSEGDSSIFIQNPLSEEYDVMRSSLLSSQFEIVASNQRNGNHFGRNFEIASVFRKADTEFLEATHLAMSAWGYANSLWFDNKKENLVLSLKEDVEELLGFLGFSHCEWRKLEKYPPLLHPTQSASLFIDEKAVGLIGSIHPQLSKKWKLRDSVAFFELNFDLLLQKQSSLQKYREFGRFPGVERDLAFVVNADAIAGDIMKSIQTASGKYFRKVELFDFYRGENLDPEKKSLAFRIAFQDAEQTMNDSQIARLQDKIIQEVCQKHVAEVR